jgi:predicted enzyme related to lactoylglutathione lyase
MRPGEFRFYYFTPLYEQTVAFYRDVLGFEIYHAWDRGAGERGTIFRSPGGAGLIEIEEGGRPPSVVGGFYIEVEDVERRYDDVRRRGGAVLRELGATSYGHRNFKTLDPNGVEVTFFEYLVRPPHAGGGVVEDASETDPAAYVGDCPNCDREAHWTGEKQLKDGRHYIGMKCGHCSNEYWLHNADTSGL